MVILRLIAERLLLGGLSAARTALLMQAVAFGCAWLAAASLTPSDMPGWVQRTALRGLLASAGFGAAGVAMGIARRWKPLAEQSDPADQLWPLLLGASLGLFAAYAASAASALRPLLHELAAQLDAVGLDDALAAGGLASAALLPVMLALIVPALVIAAACASIVSPLLLLLLVATRSGRFPALLAMATIAQGALVLGGWFAASEFDALLGRAIAALPARDATEAMPVLETLQRMARVLVSTAHALLNPLLGMLGWLVFLPSSRGLIAFFSEDGQTLRTEDR
jgi:H+/Cl- antiporter ClcA